MPDEIEQSPDLGLLHDSVDGRGTGPRSSSLRDRFLKGTAWVFSGKVAASILALALNAVLARLLSPPELGAYFTVLSVVMIGSSIGQLGLDLAVVRLVAAAIGTGDAGRARSAIRSVFTYGVIGSVGVGLLLAAGLGQWMAHHVFRSSLIAAAIPLAAGWLVAWGLQSLVIETFRGFQRFDLATVLDSVFIYGVCTALFGSMWIAGRHLSLRTVVLALAIVTGVAALIGGRLILRLSHGGEDDAGPARATVVAPGELFTLAWPLLVTNITLFLVGAGIDLWVLSAFRPQSDVALYGAAIRLVAFVSTPFIILQGVAPPLVAELYAQGKRADLERAVRAIATLGGLPAAPALLLFVVLGRTILSAVFGPFYGQAGTILAILSAGRLIAVWTGSSGVALIMTGHQKAMMNINLIAGAISLAGGIALAPHFGGVGVATATSVGVALNNLLQLVYARRLVGIWTHADLSPTRLRAFLRRKAAGGATIERSGS